MWSIGYFVSTHNVEKRNRHPSYDMYRMPLSVYGDNQFENIITQLYNVLKVLLRIAITRTYTNMRLYNRFKYCGTSKGYHFIQDKLTQSEEREGI